MFNLLPNPVRLAHFLMEKSITPGSVVIDATVGNGFDTLFLAKLVGPKGKVYGFDIQKKALEEAALRLREDRCNEWVTFFHIGHENIAEKVPDPVDGIMFNLGYLPGGSHDIITKPTTTLQGLEQGMTMLRPGGIITVVVYPGHAGGCEEAEELGRFVSHLPKAAYSSIKCSFMNRSQKTPYLIAIEKKSSC